MLKLTVPAREWYYEKNNHFIPIKETTFILEHSLLSVSKWECKWKKSFFKTFERNDQSLEEEIDYIRCMTINKDVDPFVYYGLSIGFMKKVRDYINDPMTATVITNRKNGRPGPKRIITSEVIYAQMVKYGIPFECQKWHLNRLIMLIQVCSVENGPVDKMSKSEIMKQNAAINAMRKSKHHTKG